MRFQGACGLLFASVVWILPAAAANYESGYEALTAGNYVAAARLFSVESQNGDAFAKLALGHLYRVSRGVPLTDADKSAKLTLQAAEAGNCEAQYLIGTFYYRGYGLAQDQKVALDWFEKSAFCGHAGAQLVVAQAYLDQPRTGNKAVSWLRASARQGHVHALVMLADHYVETGDTAISGGVAMHLYLRAAIRGYPLAAERIAGAFKRGMAMPPNPLATKRWQDLASQLAQSRTESFVAVRENPTPRGKQSANTENLLGAGARKRAAEMASALLGTFPLPEDFFSDLPEGVSVVQDGDPRRLRPDDQYGIPQHTFFVGKGFQ